jgi:putative oxidoreductase
MTRSFASVASPYLRSTLRIVVALLFIAHGTQKLFAFPVGEPQEPVELLSLMGFAGVLETFGGALLLFGWLTRPVAFVLAGQMAAAYFMAHAPNGFWPILNGGELAALYCFAFLYLATAGAGPWSVDALLNRSRARAQARGAMSAPDAARGRRRRRRDIPVGAEPTVHDASSRDAG